MTRIESKAYEYHHLSIPGGGYVTGFIYHKRQKDILYIRTDIGGVYRFDAGKQKWISLMDHVSMEDISESFPISVALDENEPSRLYIASGIHAKEHGKLSVSGDFGNTFTHYEMPMMVHGNLNGRGTGERLLVDKEDGQILFYASQENGLYKSINAGKEFVKLNSMPESYLTFAVQNPKGDFLVVGSAGVTTKRSDMLRGDGLYISYDKGEHFHKLWHPKDREVAGIKLAGLVPQRVAFDDAYMYVTYSVMGYNAYVLEHGYSCDGGSVVGGKVCRYSLSELASAYNSESISKEKAIETPIDSKKETRIDENSMLMIGEEITPIVEDTYIDENGLLKFGFSGIAAGENVLVVSTISKGDDDVIYRSFDKGKTWKCILCGLEIGRMEFRTEYMTPKYNGGGNLIHWMTDLGANPFNENELWFNTGTGVFRTQNLLDEEVIFSDYSDGIEETVHLNLYSPPKGEVKVIDIVGDLGGFAFTQFEKPCDNSFADADGNRYITCMNADYSDANPEVVVVTPRGNWKGKTKGGLILSKDQCQTFERLVMPFGLSEDIDLALTNMERPNVDSGWVAMSQDTKHIIWSIAKDKYLPVDRIVVSHDGGKTFNKVKVFDWEEHLISELDRVHKHKNMLIYPNGYTIDFAAEGNDSSFADIEGDTLRIAGMKVFADRCCSNIFYGFGEKSRLYVSMDYGANFYEISAPDNLPKVELAIIDCANKTEIRGECGKQGVFYLALREHGLWKLIIDAHAGSVKATRMGKESDVFYRVGLGLKDENASYYTDDKALYVYAQIDGMYGFYRTLDEGISFVKLNTEKQMFGDINSIEGDSQVFGRFYIGTGSRGILYGQPADATD